MQKMNYGMSCSFTEFFKHNTHPPSFLSIFEEVLLPNCTSKQQACLSNVHTSLILRQQLAMTKGRRHVATGPNTSLIDYNELTSFFKKYYKIYLILESISMDTGTDEIQYVSNPFLKS